MNQPTGSRLTSQVVLGTLIVFVGVVLALDNMDLLVARDILRYWPALLVAYGISRLMQRESSQGKFFGGAILVVGALFLLDKLDVMVFRMRDLWPLIFLVVGGALVWRALRRPRVPDSVTDTSSLVNAFAMFSGIDRKVSTQEFRGGELTAIMGGCEIDLRRASMKPGEAVVDIFAFWGGIDIKVPEDWSVSVTAVPILGGIEDKTTAPKGGSEKRLIIRGNVIMGGAEISN
jgi:predicted membrane protein